MLMAAIRDIQYICSAVVFLKSEPEKVYMAFAYIANLGNTVASFGLPIAKANLQPLLLDTVRVALENNPSLELGQIKEIWEVERKSTLPMKSIHDVTVATKAMLQVMLQDAKNQEVFSPGKTVSVDESVENAAACLFALLDIVRYDNQVLFREKWSSSPFQVLPAGSGRKDLAAFKAVCQVYMKFKDSDSGKSKPWIANLEGPLSRHIRDRAPEVTYIGPPAWLGGNVQLVSSDTVVITELMISRVTCTWQESRDWLLDEVYCDFCFQSEQDRNRAVLSNTVGLLYPGIVGFKPVTMWTAPQMGVGKTMLAITGAIVQSDDHNETLAITTTVKDDYGLRKFLASTLRGGGKYIIFDNLKSKLDSPTLEAMTTTSNFTERLIGTGHIVKARNEGLFLHVTLNGATTSNDMARRVMTITLAANPQATETRQLRHPDFLGWVKANAAVIRGHMVNMISPWVDAGAPIDDTQPVSSFVNFTQVLGGLGKFLGLPPGVIIDTAENLKRMAADGSEHEEFLLYFLHQVFGAKGFSAQDAVEALGSHLNDRASMQRFPVIAALDPSVLIKEFDGLLNSNRVRALSTRVGMLFKRLDGKLVEIDGLKLRIQRGRKTKFCQLYQIIDVTPKPADAASAPTFEPRS